MDRQQILTLLTRIQANQLDANFIALVYAETLAKVSEKLTVEEMRRFLFVGAYLYHLPAKSDAAGESNDKPVSWRGNLNLH